MTEGMIECGTYELCEATTFTYRGHECAAWSETILVQPGTYPVRASIRYGRPDEFFVGLPGTIVEDYFQSLSCGTPIGKPYDVHQNAGKDAKYTIRNYSYSVFKSMAMDSTSPWKIDVSNLPGVIICADESCGSYGTTGHDGLCLRCAMNAKAVRLFNLNRRHKVLIDAVQKAGHKVDRHASIFDQTLEHYLTSGRTDGYHRECVVNAVRKLRELRRDAQAHRSVVA